MTQASSSGTTYGRGDAPCWLVVPLRGETHQHRAKPCPLISPPGVPGTRVCLMFYLGGIASQNRIHPTPRSYREWPGYQESFISFNARERPFIPMPEGRGYSAENW